MKISKVVIGVAGAVVLCTGAMAQEMSEDTSLSFFITSMGSGDGGNLDGLAGADAICKNLASNVGQGDKDWKAYLSTNGDRTVNARDRIGAGPWYNANGVMVAMNVDDLHSDNNKLSKENSLDEAGNMIKGRGDSPNQHDILTGSDLMGMSTENTCSNWTSSAEDGSGNVGHHDRTGGGANPTSWNFAHPSRGCSQTNLVATGGNGYFYCFAAK
ncbi:hypothetical protein [Pseudemcibacter aquimaris]|uniref:hypothetical protein n=1 Tax=Pseudemcibacter aquimaris TaxID=2857064 RepID=UPI002010F6FA|nr:hypothetical protein [Pseudemcibacter aquimaris]MCC3859860.1 hypothetical protein [Pseudemcibacter aquimaris]WDU57192.1 hypothetical protein KW060_08275 [Pseudemcibacter aquimaris]